MSLSSIVALLELIAALPPDLAVVCNRLFHIAQTTGTTVPPPAMLPWIERHFGMPDGVRKQTIIKVTNRLTLEATIFNPLRGLRPMDKGDDARLDALIAESAGARDTFGDPLNGTPADAFGRIKGEYCVTASNVAKYDGWHGVIVFDEMHPLHWGRAQLHDYLNTALHWLHAAHAADSRARYPIITWNCLWKSGASITHGHMQMSLSNDMPYAAIERWRSAAVQYCIRYGGHYFDDLWQLHQALGLAFVERADVRGYATLTPLKDRELLLTTPMIDQATLSSSLIDATYDTLRCLIDNYGMRSFNLAVYLPPFGAVEAGWEDMPCCVRIVERGNPTSRMVDIGAMELFGSSVVTTDPFAVASALRNEP